MAKEFTISPFVSEMLTRTGKLYDMQVSLLENIYHLGFINGELKGAHDTNALYGKMLAGGVK